ncbi:hypothetical protein Aperf_G00000104932 [Anoplocephala perfoliata]
MHAVNNPDMRWIEMVQDFYLISLPSLIILSCNVLVLISILYALIFRLKDPKNFRPSVAPTDLPAIDGNAVENTLSQKHEFKSSIFRRYSSNRPRFRLPARFNRAESMKSLKACLMLIPLLGIPQVIFIVPYHSSVVQIFTYINAIVTSTQVRVLLRNSCHKLLLQNNLRRHRHPPPTTRRMRQRSTLEYVFKSDRASSVTHSV